jgi:4-diphosphocytidyl-2-C-methyl-D-erythritol kinase
VDKIALHSYAKLNLYLNVLGKRKDNYHNIETLFERISLCDKIILKTLPDKKIKITSNLAALPRDSSNLAYQAAHCLQEAYGVNKGVEIKIIKRIPVASGMAGGSSNAAAVLCGLNKLWGLNASSRRLANLAGEIGADVAFFIYDSAFALGKGCGNRITPLKALNKRKFWHVLVVPRIDVSTPFIYRQWDRLIGRRSSLAGWLTRRKNNVKILTSALKKNDQVLIEKALFNSLEYVSSSVYRQITKVKENLARQGAGAVLMSGSGPTVFCFVSSRKEGERICRQLRKNRFWQVFLAHTH